MTRKHLLSTLSLIVFIYLALACASSKYYGRFDKNNQVEDRQDKGNYAVNNDGTRIYGKKVKFQSGLFSKGKVEVDDQKYPVSEIIGYRDGMNYYGRMQNYYIRRIVHGKINIY